MSIYVVCRRVRTLKRMRKLAEKLMVVHEFIDSVCQTRSQDAR